MPEEKKTIKKPSTELVAPNISKPETLKAFSVELKRFIVSENLYTPIQGKNYVNVEGWQFAGASMGLVPVVESCDRLEREGEIAYRTTVNIFQGERVVSRGFAICSDKESKRKNADEYVIASMAQTRAIGKAYRLLIGFLMKMAGYEATPSEEMQTESFGKAEPVTDKAEDLGNCDQCHAPKVKSKVSGKIYCGAKCWLKPAPKKEYTPNEQEFIDSLPQDNPQDF